MNQRLPFCKVLFAFISIIYTSILWANNQWGMSAGYAASPFGIDNASQSKGGRLTVDDHFPPAYWHNFELFFQGSAAYYHSNYEPLEPISTDSLVVFSFAPVIRYHFAPISSVDPFIDLSVGLGYLSTTHYENRNFGIHLTAQDMLGIGAAFGQEHQWTAALQIIHYSNAGVSDNNRGFTSPVCMSMSYLF